MSKSAKIKLLEAKLAEADAAESKRKASAREIMFRIRGPKTLKECAEFSRLMAASGIRDIKLW
jgi:hypothetical protein